MKLGEAVSSQLKVLVSCLPFPASPLRPKAAGAAASRLLGRGRAPQGEDRGTENSKDIVFLTNFFLSLDVRRVLSFVHIFLIEVLKQLQKKIIGRKVWKFRGNARSQSKVNPSSTYFNLF